MFKYKPEWQGPLSGPSFEKQTEDFLNGIESRVDEIDARQTPSDATPMSPGVGDAGSSLEYSRGDHSHPLQTDISGHAGSADSVPWSGVTDRPMVTPEDFGAIGDGVADDTAAVQAALSSGSPVLLKGSVYAVSSLVIPAGTAVCGDAEILDRGDLASGSFVEVGAGASIESLRVRLSAGHYVTGVKAGGSANIGLLSVESDLQVSSQAVQLCGDAIFVDRIKVKNIDRGIEIGAGPDIVPGTGATIDAKTHYSGIHVGSYYVDSCVQGLKFSRATSCSVGQGIVNGLPDSISLTPTHGYNGILISGSDNLQIGSVKMDRILEHGIRIGNDEDRVDDSTMNFLTHDIVFSDITSSRHGGSCLKIHPGPVVKAYNIFANDIASVDAGMRGRENTRRLSALRLSFCTGFSCDSVTSRYSDPSIVPSQAEIYETDVVELEDASNVSIASLSADACGRSLVCFHELNDNTGGDPSLEACSNITINSITCANSFNDNSFYLSKFYNTGMVVNAVRFENVYVYGTGFSGYFNGQTAANVANFVLICIDRDGKSYAVSEIASVTSFAARGGDNILSTGKQFDASNALNSSSLSVMGARDSANTGYGSAIAFPRKHTYGRPGAAIAEYQETLGSADCGLAFLMGANVSATNTIVERWRMVKTNNALLPSNDNANTIGSASLRLKEIFCANSTINTSDERLKTGIADPDESLMRAWGRVRFAVYRMRDAVEAKGDAARLHVGVIAQEVLAAFEAEGLDATRYGLLCHDQWPERQEPRVVIDKPAELDSDGNVVAEEVAHTEMQTIPAGDRYSVRYGEALALECAYQRWLGEKRDARIAALESALAE